MTPLLRWLPIALIAAAGTSALATGQASSYKIPSDAFNSGLGSMTSSSYRLGASLGDTFLNAPIASPGYALAPGFASDVDIAVAQVTPGSLVFGSQSVGTSGGAQSVTVTNVGAAPLSLANIAIGSDFGQSSNCGGPIAPGANCSFAVIFAPRAAGTRSGSLSFTANSAGSPYSVSLSGTGTLASQTIHFGAAPTISVGGTGAVTATGGGSGNPVTFSSRTNSICTQAGSTVTGMAVGMCTIAADQAGNAGYAAAATVTQSFNVTVVSGGGGTGDVPLPPWAAALLAAGLLSAMSRYRHG